MYTYSIIDSDAKWSNLRSSWKQEGISSFAIDFEGEFNLHIYGEHLCLIQIYDGRAYYLVDPFALDMKDVLQFLSDSRIEKVMFDSSSDASLIYKEYGVAMDGVYDVALSAGLLEFTGNLHALIGFCGIELPVVTNKKKNQMANWLRRPLQESLIAYALSDVEHLFAIKEYLQQKIRKEGKESEEIQVQKQGTKVKTEYKPGWTKLPGYQKMSKRERVYLRHFFLARDRLAREKNQPAYRILDKKILVSLARDPSQRVQLVTHRERNTLQTLMGYLEEANRTAEEELS